MTWRSGPAASRDELDLDQAFWRCCCPAASTGNFPEGSWGSVAPGCRPLSPPSGCCRVSQDGAAFCRVLLVRRLLPAQFGEEVPIFQHRSLQPSKSSPARVVSQRSRSWGWDNARKLMQISLRSSPQTFGKTFSSRNKAGEDVGEQGAFHRCWHGRGDTRGLPAPCATSCARSRERTDIPPFTPFWVSLLSVCSRLHPASPSLHHCLPTPRDSGFAGCHRGPMCHCHPLSRFP